MRNTYFVPAGRIADYPHPNPDRTCYRAGRGIFDDVEFKVFPNRPAMLEMVKRSNTGALGHKAWKALRQQDSEI